MVIEEVTVTARSGRSVRSGGSVRSVRSGRLVRSGRSGRSVRSVRSNRSGRSGRSVWVIRVGEGDQVSTVRKGPAKHHSHMIPQPITTTITITTTTLVPPHGIPREHQ